MTQQADHPEVLAYACPPPRLASSRLGIASCLVALGALCFMVLCALAAGACRRSPENSDLDLRGFDLRGIGFWLLASVGVPAITIAGGIIGTVGLVRPQRHKAFAVFGTLLNAGIGSLRFTRWGTILWFIIERAVR